MGSGKGVTGGSAGGTPSGLGGMPIPVESLVVLNICVVFRWVILGFSPQETGWLVDIKERHNWRRWA